MNNLDFNITLALFALGIGIVFASGIWFLIAQWVKKRTIARTRKEFESRLPLTIEEIEAERELTRAQHVYDLRTMELRISELVLREAEANLKTQTAMSRVGQLNDRVERLRLELTAARKRKKINVDTVEERS
jgi:hypothetical protein